jgi:GNAT superfamily N-acetyltransferase
MNFFIREAKLDDLPALKICEQGVIAAERPMDVTIKEGPIFYYNLPDLIQREDCLVLVVEIEKKIIGSGYALLKPDRPYLKHKLQGYLGFMFVDEEFRGKGINGLIIDELSAWCKSKGVYEIRLDVYDVNYPAIKAYEKAGFKRHLITMRKDIS